MTQYLLSVHYVDGEGATQRTIDETPGADAAAEMQKAFERVERFNEKLQAEGKWVFAGGLQTPDTSRVVDASKGGEALVTDGPFSEAKEQIGGFWVIEAADLDEALQIAAEGSAACAGPVEVRPFQGE
jgi:hypothetical protein